MIQMLQPLARLRLVSTCLDALRQVTIRQHLLKGCTSLLIGSSLIFNVSPSAAQAPTKQWDKRFGGNRIEQLGIGIQTSDGGYLLGGSSDSDIGGDKSVDRHGPTELDPNSWNPDYWIVKMDANGNKQWDKRFGGIYTDDLMAVIQCADGGYLLAGTSYSPISGEKTENNRDGDYWIVKIDAQGNKQWDKRFGGINEDYLTTVIQSSDGGYLLAGYSQSGIGAERSQPSWGAQDYWVIKIDAQGTKQWDKRFGGTNDDYLSAVVQSSDGGYLLAGYSDSEISGDISEVNRGASDYWVVKIDAQGTKQWDKRFGGTDDEMLPSVLATLDGGYLLIGASESEIGGDISEVNRGESDYWIVKMDANGTKQWDKRFGGSAREGIWRGIQTLDGGYVLAGYSQSSISGDVSEASKGEYDNWLVKINSSGNKQWDKRFGGSENDYCFSVVQCTDGGYFLSGISISGISGDKSEDTRGEYDFWVVKTTPETAALSTVRINAGGTSYKTVNGAVFGPDAYYEGDTKTTPFQNYGIANTLDDALYRTDRVGNVDKKTFRYQIPVTNGEYQVRLHFSENYFREAGRRVFSVAAEGEAKLVNYDIYASVGRKYAVIKTYPVTVTDGNLTLDFSATVNRAKINAIEVVPATMTLAREQTEVVDIREASPVLQASPNPFSEQTTLNFQLDQTQGAILQLYTLQGQLVRTLFAGEVEAGILQQIALDGAGLPNGVYLVRLVTDEQVSHLKVVLNQ